MVESLALPLLFCERRRESLMTTKVWSGSLVGSLLIVMLMAEPLAAQTAKARDLSDEELIALIQNAKTPADHEKLAAYYDQTAADLTATATRHKELAAIYRRMPPEKHCKNIAISAAKGAEEARAIAQHHRMLAKQAAAAH